MTTIQEECGHRFECGCGKPTCMEMDGEECDDIELCSNEGCKHYYDSRNDNCDCNDKDCPYCEEEEDCVCGNNFHKGWVDGVMRCEDCDIDGKNYEGSDEEADAKKVVEIVGCDAECGQDSKYSDMYGNNYCSKKCEYREE